MDLQCQNDLPGLADGRESSASDCGLARVGAATAMRRMRILVDSLADESNFNAQMTSARDIVARLNPDKFDVRIFHVSAPDPRIATRPNTRLICLPQQRQTVRILHEFGFGDHDILFYVKSSPAAKAYFSARSVWRDRRVTIGTVESQSDWHNEPT